MTLEFVMKGLKFAGIVLLTAYLVTLAIMFFFQRSFLYFPNAQSVSASQAGLDNFEDVTLVTADELTLNAWFHTPSETAPVILFMHGNAGGIADRRNYYRYMADLGFGVLALEYRGYSGNPGHPHEEGLYMDARAAMAFLAERSIAPARLILMGVSLGSGVAVHMATEIDARALVLVSPYTSLPDVAAEHYGYLPVQWLTHDRFTSIDKIASVAMPLLIFHGAQDTLIPAHLGRRLFDAAVEPKQFFMQKRAGHNTMDMGAIIRKVSELYGEDVRKL